MSPAALAWLCAVLAALAAALGARLPGYDLAFGAALLVGVAWRLVLGRDGRRLLPRRVLAALTATLLALGLPFLFDRGSTGPEAGLGALLGVLSTLLTAALLGRIDSFGAFWVVLLSSVHAAAACYVGRDLVGLLLVPAYVAVLAATLVVLERALSSERALLAGGPVTVLRDPGTRLGRPLVHSTARLVGAGFALGLVVWLAAPRPDPEAPATARRAAAGAAPSSDERASGTLPPGSGAGLSTGPDEQAEGAAMGGVGRIQEDRTVHIELRRTQGRSGETFLLREDALDLWTDSRSAAATGWRSSQAGERVRVLRPGADGWVVRAEADPADAVRAYTLRLRRPRLKLYLEPEVLRVRLLRAPDGAPDEAGVLAPRLLPVLERGSGELRPAQPLEAGDVVEAVSRPQPRGGPGLLGRTSHSSVAPLRVYTELDPLLAARLLEASRGVPGVRQADPWLRAQALEAWLKSPAFAYELASPRLEPGDRVMDFLTRARTGNCEWFATALTLLLRAHGLPARYVRGYWGGSHTPDSDLWTFYGAHYHAWSELYLEGAGWVPLNPTPPERLAEGADPRTSAGPAQAGAEEAPGDGPGAGLRRWAAGAFREAVVEPLRWSFSPRGAYLGVGLLLLLACGLLARGALRSRAVAGVAPRGRAASSAYVQGLRLLAKHGVARARTRTARQFLADARGLLSPQALEGLAGLTALHEAQRYGGAPEDPAAAREALRALSSALA